MLDLTRRCSPSPATPLRAQTFVLVASLLLAGVGTAAAQGRRQPAPQVPKTPLKTSGKIQQIIPGSVPFMRESPGAVQVETGDGGKWLVAVPQDPQNVRIEGSAELSWLRPGMLVRFTGRFDSKGRIQGPVSDLTVFTLREGYVLGIFSDAEFGEQRLFEADDEKPAKRAPQPEVKSFLVAGQLVGARNNKYKVLAQGQTIQFELTEKATVKLDVADFRVARPGDKVEIDGWYPANQEAQRLAVANRMTFTLAEPLTGAKPKKTVRKGATKPAERSPFAPPAESEPAKEKPGGNQQTAEGKQADN